jgi:hypothetical protein
MWGTPHSHRLERSQFPKTNGLVNLNAETLETSNFGVPPDPIQQFSITSPLEFKHRIGTFSAFQPEGLTPFFADLDFCSSNTWLFGG